MTNKYDLETRLYRHDGAATTITNLGGDVVPTGKTRFLTYIRVERLGAILTGQGSDATGILVAIGSSVSDASEILDIGSITTAAKAKLIIQVATYSTARIIPEDVLRKEIKGSIENPVLSVTGGNFMVLGTPLAMASASIFVQYYDA